MSYLDLCPPPVDVQTVSVAYPPKNLVSVQVLLLLRVLALQMCHTLMLTHTHLLPQLIGLQWTNHQSQMMETAHTTNHQSRMMETAHTTNHHTDLFDFVSVQ